MVRHSCSKSDYKPSWKTPLYNDEWKIWWEWNFMGIFVCVFYHDIPMTFPWNSHDIPMTFQWKTPRKKTWTPSVCRWFSHGTPPRWSVLKTEHGKWPKMCCWWVAMWPLGQKKHWKKAVKGVFFSCGDRMGLEWGNQPYWGFNGLQGFKICRRPWVFTTQPGVSKHEILPSTNSRGSHRRVFDWGRLGKSWRVDENGSVFFPAINTGHMLNMSGWWFGTWILWLPQ